MLSCLGSNCATREIKQRNQDRKKFHLKSNIAWRDIFSKEIQNELFSLSCFILDFFPVSVRIPERHFWRPGEISGWTPGLERSWKSVEGRISRKKYRSGIEDKADIRCMFLLQFVLILVWLGSFRIHGAIETLPYDHKCRSPDLPKVIDANQSSC